MARTTKPITLAKATASGKGYTRTQLVRHLIGAVEKARLEPVNRAQVLTILEAFNAAVLDYAKSRSGGLIPGLGKVKIRELAARPARVGINPKTGTAIEIPAKPKRKKLVFRFAKDAKAAV